MLGEMMSNPLYLENGEIAYRGFMIKVLLENKAILYRPFHINTLKELPGHLNLVNAMKEIDLYIAENHIDDQQKFSVLKNALIKEFDDRAMYLRYGSVQQVLYQGKKCSLLASPHHNHLDKDAITDVANGAVVISKMIGFWDSEESIILDLPKNKKEVNKIIDMIKEMEK